ncbi:phosphate signaling complex protein PhoU [Desertibaculum subflavum]|uniref:phosphate signaling complex protein PhoU n=1 Tax=Desertibaculum subflavum TaxID=2268458 RepID=UPI000E662E47
MPSDHTVKSFDEELSVLDNSIARMGGLAEAQFAGAITALARRDSELATSVIAADAKVDGLQGEIDQRALKALALRQPMANDLRTIVGSLRIAGELERIADYAANLAKRSIALNQAPVMPSVTTVARMGELVRAMIKDVIDAYLERSVEKAREVWRRDADVDEIYNSLFRELLTYMMEDPRNISPCTHLLFIAKNIERMGDHATNIAELVEFSVTGMRVREERPKQDRTAFAVVEPPATRGGRTGSA